VRPNKKLATKKKRPRGNGAGFMALVTGEPMFWTCCLLTLVSYIVGSVVETVCGSSERPSEWINQCVL
jgi:hypothetical protein